MMGMDEGLRRDEMAVTGRSRRGCGWRWCRGSDYECSPLRVEYVVLIFLKIYFF